MKPFLFFILLANSIGYGQQNSQIFFRTSYNSFAMTDLKHQQNELLSDVLATNIPAKNVYSYPSYYGFQGGILLSLNQESTHTKSIGVIVEFTSTGGRIHYQDYSGEILFDQLVHTIGLGGIYEYCYLYSANGHIGFQIAAKFYSSSFKNSLVNRLGNNKQTLNLNFHSYSFGFEPGIVPGYTLFNVRAGVSFSYLLFLPTALEYDNYSDAFFVNKKGNKVTIDWSGFRIGLLVGYSF